MDLDMFVLPDEKTKATVVAKAKVEANAKVKKAAKVKANAKEKTSIKSPAKKPQLSSPQRAALLEQVVLGIRSKTPKGNAPKGNFQGVQTVKKVIIKKPASKASRRKRDEESNSEAVSSPKKVMKVMKVTQALCGSMVGKKAR